MTTNALRPSRSGTTQVGSLPTATRRSSTSDPASTTLSVFEVNYLLARLQIREVMRVPITVPDDTPLEEAARLMQYQQMYQAAAKVIQAAQSMFDTLLAATSR